MVERICQFCGKKFLVWPAWIRKGGGKFCSRSCHHGSRKGQRFEIVCNECGKKFTSGTTAYKICSVCLFWTHVKKMGLDECWPWTGPKYQQGYGSAYLHGKMTRANRGMWTIYNGTIPDGKFVLHKCDNRICVNPSHLYLGTHLDNMRDIVMRNKHRKTAKLKRSDIPNIRAMIKDGESYNEIAKKFNVCGGTIYNVDRGRNWSHVK